MRLSRPALTLVLFFMLLAAVATRYASTGRLDSPYFKGTAAMDYRHALEVADGIALMQPDPKAGAPLGHVPSRTRATGYEYATGVLYRISAFFSETDGRQFVHRVGIMVSALSVLAAYLLAGSVWRSRASGLVAAFLVAFLAPLVVTGNGRVYSHTHAAMLLGTVHAWLALRAIRRGGVAETLAAATAAFALLTAWEPAPLVLAAWVVCVSLDQSHSRATRRRFALAHALVVVTGSLVLPHLAAVRAIASTGVLFTAACVVVLLLPPRMSAGWRRVAWTIGLGAAWTVVGARIRAGAPEQFPALEYIATRLRFAFGRPDDASALSDWMRALWSVDHAPLPPHSILELFVPLVLLGVGAALGARTARALTRVFALFLVASFAVLLDRAALPVAGLIMVVVAAGGAVTLRTGPRVRIALVAMALYLAFAGTVFRGKVVDPVLLAARGAGVAYQDPHGFVWVSLENTDRELVRFVATRTSVRETILGPRDVSGLLIAFTGRSIAQLPGSTSREPCERSVSFARAMLGGENSLYDLCRGERIDYVLYSIDTMLDTGRYSPRYTAALPAPAESSIAYSMHFDPESIRHFTLLYENDHYRLFKVTDSAEPVFLTDHPPFYQRDLFELAGRDVDTFRERAVFLMLTCAEGTRKRAVGDLEGARRQLDWCVRQAPRFTRARLALADVLLDMQRFAEARAAVTPVVQYAPDNMLALYYAAYIEAQLGNRDAARPYLTLIFTHERDPEQLERARHLQSALDRSSPLPPERP